MGTSLDDGQQSFGTRSSRPASGSVPDICKTGQLATSSFNEMSRLSRSWVARRTNEIGVRMALGATRSQILSLILRQSAGLLAVGLAAGATLTIAAAQTVKSLLFSLHPNDAGTLALAILLLAIVTQAASYLAARGAARLEPTAALREE